MTRTFKLFALLVVIVSWSVPIPALSPAEAGRSIEPQASKVDIRMATPVPKGTIWDKSLNMMGAQWSKGTNQRVNLIVFPVGQYGDDDSVVRQMRHNDPPAAALTAIGLSRIDGAFSALGLPFFYDSEEEFNHVVDALTPELKKRAAAKGFVILAWAPTGWAHLFSKTKVASLDDLKKLKLFTSLGDEEMVQWYRTRGFQPQALSYSDIELSLGNGMIGALPAPPAAVNAFNWWKRAPFMVDAAIAPVIGAVVITQKTFDRISEVDRTVLVEAAGKLQAELRVAVPDFEKKSIKAMQDKGLAVTTVEAAQWSVPSQAMVASLRGTMVPPEMFDQALKARDDYRAKHAVKR